MDDGHPSPKAVSPVNQRIAHVSQAGLDLIKEFEGCKLTSYLCPSNVWTIGYGSTAGVGPGMTITQAEADALLQQDLRTFEDGVAQLINVPLTQHEFDAIVSFAFNCGLGALQSSTFRRRMNAGEDKAL